ncbi:MAG TPA: heavy metal-associated domain-containing protein [Cellvibrio sp.]|jgi:copper chaperone CopZ
MKKIILLTTVLIAFAGTAHADTIKANVNGLVCSFCATGIEKTFKKQSAVEKVHVDLESKLVTISTKTGQNLEDATVKKLITDAGYSVTNIKREK